MRVSRASLRGVSMLTYFGSFMSGRTFSHYRVLETIGTGGMGVVYRAYDERLGREVAVKVLDARKLADEVARKRFQKEARMLSRVNHPNIATIHDFGTHAGVDFLVMEYVPGLTLDVKLAQGALAESEALQLGTQLALGLEAAHQVGVAHCDLKPGNLRVTPDCRLKILDHCCPGKVGGNWCKRLIASGISSVGAGNDLKSPEAVTGLRRWRSGNTADNAGNQPLTPIPPNFPRTAVAVLTSTARHYYRVSGSVLAGPNQHATLRRCALVLSGGS